MLTLTTRKQAIPLKTKVSPMNEKQIESLKISVLSGHMWHHLMRARQSDNSSKVNIRYGPSVITCARVTHFNRLVLGQKKIFHFLLSTHVQFRRSACPKSIRTLCVTRN